MYPECILSHLRENGRQAMSDINSRSIKQPGSAIAVALQYGDTTSTVPTITATGKGDLAEQILQLAFEHGVKVREDADLAQILSEVDVDCPIPLEALAAVSEILSYLYKSQNKPQSDLSESNAE